MNFIQYQIDQNKYTILFDEKIHPQSVASWVTRGKSVTWLRSGQVIKSEDPDIHRLYEISTDQSVRVDLGIDTQQLYAVQYAGEFMYGIAEELSAVFEGRVLFEAPDFNTDPSKTITVISKFDELTREVMDQVGAILVEGVWKIGFFNGEDFIEVITVPEGDEHKEQGRHAIMQVATLRLLHALGLHTQESEDELLLVKEGKRLMTSEVDVQRFVLRLLIQK